MVFYGRISSFLAVIDPNSFGLVFSGMSESSSPTAAPSSIETSGNDPIEDDEAAKVNPEVNPENPEVIPEPFMDIDDDLGITDATAAAIDSIVHGLDVVEELQDDVDLGLDVIEDHDEHGG